MARMSILGMLDYDPDLFEDFVLPTAGDITDNAEVIADPWEPDIGLAIVNIIRECNELELLYPSVPTMKLMIAIWSAVNFQTWCGLYNTMIYKYNPIWNKEGTYTETHNLTVTDDYTVTNMKTTHGGNIKNNVTGYDSSTYSPDTQMEQDTNDTTNGKTKNTHSDRGTLTKAESGNIGVTSTQDMIRQQREIVEFNFYQYIAQSFKENFCIMVY